jgi:hypothetical protein
LKSIVNEGGMKATELLLAGIAAWTAIGLLGIIVSHRRGERNRVRRGVAWLAAVWILYLLTLIGFSLLQKQRIIAIGQQQCFGKMCFIVTGTEEVPGYLIRDGRRLIRVPIQITNRGTSTKSDNLIHAYMLDAQGRRWEQSTGISGVRLTATVAPGASVVSEPVFKVSGDATGLKLVFTHGWKQPGVLVIGDSDSLLHRHTAVDLAR